MRQQCDERQRDNQPDKRHKRGAMRGDGAMSSKGTGGQEAVACYEVTRQPARVDNKRGTTKGRNKRQRCNKSWRHQ